jgi:tape measure domain-containing protein
MNNSGSLNAIIGADIGGYQKAMNDVENLTRQAFNSANKAAQSGSQGMLRTIQVMLSSIVRSTNSDVNRILNQFSGGFTEATAIFRRVVAGIGEKLPEPFRRGLSNVLDFSRNQFSSLATLTAKTARTMGSSMQSFADKLPAPLGNAVSAMGKKLQQFGYSVSTTFTRMGQTAYKTSNDIKQTTTNTIDQILNAFKSKILEPFTSGIKGIGTAFSNAFKGIGSIINNSLIQPMVNAGKAVLNFGKIMGNALIVEPFLLIRDAIVGITKAIGSGLLNAVRRTGSFVKNYMLAPLMEVVDVAVQIAREFGQAVLSAVTKVGHTINNYFLTPIMNTVKWVGNLTARIGKGLLSAVQSVGRFINTYMIQPLVSVGRVVLDITRYFVSLGATIARDLMRPIFAVGRAINTYILQPIMNVGRQFAQVGRDFASQMGSSFRSIGTAFGNTFNVIGQGFMRLPRFAANAVNQVADRFNPLVTKAGNVSNRMVTSFSRGFNNMNRVAGNVLNKISQKFATGTRGANGFKDSVMQLASAFSLAGLASKAINMITSSLDGAISRYDTLNQFPRIMEMWGFSAESADGAMDRLVDGIDGLPTRLDDITGNVQRLTSVTGDLDGSTDAAIALNNAFLASGASTADASRGMEQYIQMLSTGKVDMQSWRTLQETMPGALNQTAEAFGYAGNSATQDFYEALKDGEITFDDFQDKLIELSGETGGFADQAREATKGIRTSFQNLQTAISRNMEGIIRKFDEVADSRGLPGIADMLDGAKVAVDELGTAVQNVVPNIIDGFMRLSGFDLVAMLAIPKLLTLTGKLGVKLGGLSTHAHNGADGILNAFKGTQGAFKALSDNTLGFKKTMSTVANSGVQALGGMVSAITSIASVALSAIGPTAILGLIVVGLGIIHKSFGTEINNMLNMVTEKAPEVIGRFVRGIAEKLPDLILAGTAMIEQLTSTIVALLPMVMDAGMFALSSLIRGINAQFPSLINSALQIITVLATSILNALPQLVLMGMEIILAFVQGIMANTDAIIQSAQTILFGFINSFVANLPAIIQTGVQIILSLIDGLTAMMPQLLVIGFQALISLVEGIFANLPLLLNGAIAIVQSLANFVIANLPVLLSMGMQLLMTIINGIFQNLPALMNAGIQIIMILVQTFISMFPQMIMLGFELITNIATGIAQNLPLIISAGIQLVLEFIVGIFGMLPEIWTAGWEIIKALGRGLLEAIPNILTGAWEGIKSGFGSMWDWITGKNEEGVAQTGNQFNTMNTNATNSTSQMATNVHSNATNATNYLNTASSQAQIMGTNNYSSLANNVGNSMSTMSGNVNSQMGSQLSSVSTNTGQLSSLGYGNYQALAGNVSGTLSGMTGDVDSQTGSQLSTVSTNLSGVSNAGSTEYSALADSTSSSLASMTTSVETETQAQQSAVEDGTNASNKQAEKSYNDMAKTAKQALTQMTQTSKKSFNDIKTQTSSAMKSMLTNVRSSLTSMRVAFSKAMSQITSNTRQQMNASKAVVSSSMRQMVSAMRSATSQARSAGMNVGFGFRNGLSSTRGSIIGTARSIASTVTSTISSALAIRSPSRKLIELGSYAGEGLDVGLAGWIDNIKKTSLQLAQAMMLDDYELQTSLATSASIESSGVSSRLDNLSDEVQNVERVEPVFEIHSHWDGEEVYYYVKRKDARKENTTKYFRD